MGSREILHAASGFLDQSRFHSRFSQVISRAKVEDEHGLLKIMPDCLSRLGIHDHVSVTSQLGQRYLS